MIYHKMGRCWFFIPIPMIRAAARLRENFIATAIGFKKVHTPLLLTVCAFDSSSGCFLTEEG
jgi:hypothetical protein